MFFVAIRTSFVTLDDIDTKNIFELLFYFVQDDNKENGSTSNISTEPDFFLSHGDSLYMNSKVR